MDESAYIQPLPTAQDAQRDFDAVTDPRELMEWIGVISMSAWCHKAAEIIPILTAERDALLDLADAADCFVTQRVIAGTDTGPLIERMSYAVEAWLESRD